MGQGSPLTVPGKSIAGLEPRTEELCQALAPLWHDTSVLKFNHQGMPPETLALASRSVVVVSAEAGLRAISRGVRTLRGAPGRIPVKSASIDVALLDQAFERFTAAPEAGAELLRVLNDGAIAVAIWDCGANKLSKAVPADLTAFLDAHFSFRQSLSAIRSADGTLQLAVAPQTKDVDAEALIFIAGRRPLAAVVWSVLQPFAAAVPISPPPVPRIANPASAFEPSRPTATEAPTQASETAQQKLTLLQQDNERLAWRLEAEHAQRAETSSLIGQWQSLSDAAMRQLEDERAYVRRLGDDLLEHQNAAEDRINSLKRQLAEAIAEKDAAATRAANLQNDLTTALASLDQARAMRAELDAQRRANAELQSAIAQLQSTNAEQDSARAAQTAALQQSQSQAAQVSAELAELRALPAEIIGGDGVIAAAGTLAQQRSQQRAQLWSQFHARPRARKAFAKPTRTGLARSLLRRHWIGRALILLASGLYQPQDGPGGRAIMRFARQGEGASPHPLFDPSWYLHRNPDVRSTGLNSALHYLLFGDAENRSPHPLFDVRWYRETHREALSVWPLTALEHYLLHGARDGLSPHPLFDTAFYAGQTRAPADRGENPLAHYLGQGWREDASPHPLFANGWYLEQNVDVLKAQVPPLLHYVLNGAAEGRDPHPLFSTRHYLNANPDVAAVGINPLAHYVLQGWREGRAPGPDFDPRRYLDANPDVAKAGVDPLRHYLTQGGFEARAGLGDFNPQTFAALNSATILNGMTPLEAFIRAGRPSAPTRGSSVRALPAPAQSAADSGELFTALHQSGREKPTDTYNWPAYVGLSQALAQKERRRIEAFNPTPGALLDLKPEELAARARAIVFDPPARPDVSIIIPAYNQAKYTIECLASLAAAAPETEARFEVILADDASSDETQRLAASIKGLRVVRSDANQGFLKNVNGAASQARGDVLLILNNDVQVTPGFLDPLVFALQDKTIGAASPKLLFPNGRLQEAGARLHEDASARLIGLFDDPDAPRYNYARDVDYVSGACFAIRRSDFEALGGFDLRYAPAYCEDADLCLQLRANGLRIRYEPKSVVYHHLSVTSNALPGSYKMRQARRNQQKLITRFQDLIARSNQVRTIALYLPQFHAIRENDAWWGAGFTEWRNVQRALPNFSDHYQPHRPAELGHYDLSNPDVMDRQAELARDYGVHGFCYYYYSFSGRRVLDMPLERMLATGKPDLPFCVCWANENWTRTWDGGDKDILLAQRYRPEDDIAIIEDLIRYLRQPNYIRIHGKPLLVIYRPGLLPDLARTVATWRRICREQGIGEIYLAAMEVFDLARAYKDPRAMGLDASIEFPPSGMSEMTAPPGRQLNPNYTGIVSDYRRIVEAYLNEPVPAYTRFRGVMPSWDNTARRQDNSYFFHHASPGAFQAWLEAVLQQTKDQNHGDERMVFINAWNEWAEGAHLEPDLRFGRGWLEAVRNAYAGHNLLAKARMP